MEKILFIGNSFTYFNDLPAMTEELLKAAGSVCRADSVTKGGAYLHEYTDPEHELNRRFAETYGGESYDFVVLQDQSFNPAGNKADFMSAVSTLAAALRAGGKRPTLLFYQTWAYRYGSEKLSGTGIDYETMRLRLKAAYEEAAARFGGRCIPVGTAFAAACTLYPDIVLYNDDAYHPTPAGTYLAALLFANAVADVDINALPDIDALSANNCERLRYIASALRRV